MSDESREKSEGIIKDKIKALADALHLQDNRFTLVDDASEYDSLSHYFIRLTDGPAKVKIYVEFRSRGYYSSSSYGVDLDKYYVRLSAENHYGRSVNFKHNWTFTKTEDLLQKVYDRAITIAGRVREHVDTENEEKRRSKRASDRVKKVFGVVNEYSYRGQAKFRLEDPDLVALDGQYTINHEGNSHYSLEMNGITEDQAIRIAELLGHKLPKTSK